MRAPNTLPSLDEFSGSPATSFIAPSGTYRDPEETSSRGTFGENVEPLYRSPDYPHESEIQVSPTAEGGTFTPPPHPLQLYFTHPLDYDTRVPTPGPSQATPFGRGSHLAGVAPVSPPAGTDSSDTEDEAHAFTDPDIPPVVKRAMRKLARDLESSEFVRTNRVEPILGSLEANTLMAIVSSDLWKDYGIKGQSMYSLFIKVDGEDYKCLWCGDTQRGRMQRAIGHFRVKHLNHKPFPCRLTHAGVNGKQQNWYVCPFLVAHTRLNLVLDSGRRFPMLEAVTDHQKKKQTLEKHGTLKCSRWYVQIKLFQRSLTDPRSVVTAIFQSRTSIATNVRPSLEARTTSRRTPSFVCVPFLDQSSPRLTSTVSRLTSMLCPTHE